MRILLSLLFICCLSGAVQAQRSFKGVIWYKITVEGAESQKTDSMMLVFDSTRIKIVMYLPDGDQDKKVVEKVFIDDLAAGKSYQPGINGKMESDSLKTVSVYRFRNTNRYGAVNNLLGFIYEVDPKTLTGQDIRKVQCTASLEYFYPQFPDYSFLGYQPVVVDGRIVLDYVITQANGTRPRVYADKIIPMDHVDSYFR